MAGVEGVVVAVPPQFGAVRSAGVQVGDTFVIGEERDPVADEHRAVDVPVQVRQQALPVQPQLPRGAAAVPLPRGRLVRRLPGQQQRAARAAVAADRDVRHRPPGQLVAGAARGRHAVGPGVVRERLIVRAHRQDAALARGVLGGPAADPGVVRAPVAELADGAAVHGGEVDLRVQRAPAGERDVAAVRGKPGRAGPGTIDGEPPGPAGLPARGGQGRQPEIIFGDKTQQFTVKMRETQITVSLLGWAWECG